MLSQSVSVIKALVDLIVAVSFVPAPPPATIEASVYSPQETRYPAVNVDTILLGKPARCVLSGTPVQTVKRA